MGAAEVGVAEVLAVLALIALNAMVVVFAWRSVRRGGGRR